MVDFVNRQGATRVGKHFGRSISGDPTVHGRNDDWQVGGCPNELADFADRIETVADAEHCWLFREINWSTFAHGERHRKQAHSCLVRSPDNREPVGRRCRESMIHRYSEARMAGNSAAAPIGRSEFAAWVDIAAHAYCCWVFREVDWGTFAHGESSRYNVCGTPGCRCNATPPEKHGPYYQVSFTRKGKSSSKFVRKEDLADVRRELKNYELMKTLVDRWIDLATELSNLRLANKRP